MNTTLPPDLEAKLAHFRRRVWIVKLAEGIFAALFGLGLSYLLVFVLDRFGETPAWARFCILLAGAATLGLGLPLKWHRWVWRQRRLEDVARLIRMTFPRLGDQLLGIVELVRRMDRGMRAAASGSCRLRSSRHLSRSRIAISAAPCRMRGIASGPSRRRASSVWPWLAFVVVAPAARNALVALARAVGECRALHVCRCRAAAREHRRALRGAVQPAGAAQLRHAMVAGSGLRTRSAISRR